MKRGSRAYRLAPTESQPVAPQTQRPASVDPSALKRTWGAIGAASGSALLATIVGPMVTASADGSINFDIPAAGDDTTVLTGGPDQNVIYLQPGELAPSGAPVVRLDPITVVASPRPGAATAAPSKKQQVIYLYLRPGQTPPPGAIVQQAGAVDVATTPPTPPTGSTGSTGGTGAGTTPKPTSTPPAPVVTPAPTVKPPAPTTKPSGAP